MYSVKYTERQYEISPPDEDGGEWSYRGDYGSEVTLYAIKRGDGDGFNWASCPEWEAPYGLKDIPAREPAYVVCVTYRTGDTFGSHGAFCVAAVTDSREEADDIARRCEGDNDSDASYRPWDGYFERLESVSVEQFTMAG